MHQLAGQDVERIVAFGHQIADPYVVVVGLGIGLAQQVEIFAADGQRLVRKDMITGFHRLKYVVGFLSVVSGQNDQVARAVADHPFEVVGAGIDHLLPGGRLFRPLVVGGHGRQILLHFGTLGRIDADRIRKLGKGILLQEARMEMPGIEHHQAQRPLRGFRT